jgi:hypothetical protein
MAYEDGIDPPLRRKIIFGVFMLVPAHALASSRRYLDLAVAGMGVIKRAGIRYRHAAAATAALALLAYAGVKLYEDIKWHNDEATALCKLHPDDLKPFRDRFNPVMTFFLNQHCPQR